MSALVLTMCALALGVSWWLAAARPLSVAEIDLFRWFNGWPEVLAVVLWPIMQLGAAGVAAVVGVAVVWPFGRWRGAIAVAVSLGVSWIVQKLVKDAVARGRPDDLLDLVDLRAWRVPAGPGYLSGHTSTAFAVAVPVACWLPRRWRWLPLVLASLVGVARMVVGAHFPLDVVGGAAMGIAVGLVVTLVVAAVPSRVA